MKEWKFLHSLADIVRFLKVASGLPLRNDNRHAMEIAKIALLFLDSSLTIAAPVEYGSENIRLRIGVNTGTLFFFISQKYLHNIVA